MGMYGADVAQLRALATQFERTADRLDANRLAVGNAIQIKAWVGPAAVSFRARWESEHSVKVASAVRLLRENARSIRANADDQEKTSSATGGPSITFAGVALGGALGVAAGTWDVLRKASKYYGYANKAAKAAKYATGLAFVAKNVRGGISSLKSLQIAMQFSKAYKVTSAAADFVKGGGVVSKAFGGLGVVLNVVDVVTLAKKGDVDGAIWSGAKALLGAASFIPGPVGMVATTASVAIAVYENRAAIAAVVNGAAKEVSKAAVEVGKAVSKAANAAGDAAKGFVNGVAKAAKALWPF